jgi:hypothetical protein
MPSRSLKICSSAFLIFFLVSCNIPAGTATSQTGNPGSNGSFSPTDTLLPTDTLAPTNSPTPADTFTPAATPKPNKNIVIAQLNMWYFGPGCYGGFEQFNCSGKRSTALTPALGATYFSADPLVIKQQIDWAAAYGVDAFSLEWTTPRGVGNSLENNIDDAFLKAPNLNKMRWCIFYDLMLRILQTPGLHFDMSRGMDFDNPDIYNTFVADFGHFAEKYFSQPQYLKIDGRPVLYIWGTWNAIGNFAGAFKEARKKAADLGYDVFIVGDIIRADVFNASLAASYDANTNFTLMIPGSPYQKDVGSSIPGVGRALATWQAYIKSLKVTGRKDLVNLEPGFMPQFDNRLFCAGTTGTDCIYIPATSRDQVTAMAEMVLKNAQPVGSQGWNLIWVNTWNDWAETTTVEPTVDQGPKYPAGNYGFDFLEIIRDVFGQEVFPPN